MVRRRGVGFNDDFKIIIIQITGYLKISLTGTAHFAGGCRDFKDFSKCQPWGDKWYQESQTPVLQAPSAVLPEAFNYVINTVHPDYKEIKLIDTTDLVPDERIEGILKKYSGNKEFLISHILDTYK